MGCGASTEGGAVVAPVNPATGKALEVPAVLKGTASPAASPPSSVGTADGSGDRDSDMPLTRVGDLGSDADLDSSAEVAGSPKRSPARSNANEKPQIDPTWLFDAAREGSVDTILEFA